jgi:hypothetical protein
MELLTPLGLAALGLIPPLVLLYFLKLKRVPVEISSSLLWAKALIDSRANAPFQKLRRNLLLLLQILMLILVALALARPAITVKGKATRATVIVIDGSASMAAKDEKPSRFGKAQELASDAIGDLGPNDEAMVVWAGPRPRVAASFGKDKNVLRAGIEALAPADAPADLRAALQLALSASEGRGEREIVLLSDGAFDPVQDISLGEIPVRFLKVGEKGSNLALVAVDVRRRAGGVRQGFATVANFGDTEETVDLEIKIRPEDGKGGELPEELIELKPIVVAAGSEKSEVFVVPEEGGLLQIDISPGGALKADDRVFVAVPSQGKISVGIAGNETFLVRRGLMADPRFNIRPDMQGAEASKLDAAVFVQDEPPSYAQGRYLVIAPTDGGGLFSVGSPVEDPGRIHWEQQHLITRYTGLGDAHVGKAIATTPPPGAIVLAEAGPIPIVWAYERPRLRMVVMAFDPFASDFPLRAGFPIFLGNAVDWLIAGRGTGPRVVGAGEIARGDVEEELASVVVKDPSGAKQEVPVRDSEWIYDGTFKAGVYEVEAGKKSFRFAVNLLSRAESDVRPRSSLAFGTAKVTAEEGERVARRKEIWPWLAVFAVGMLVGEWWYFHKRGG